MIQTNYNPDVLSCLANLSNDEVFTPPEVVNNMLDMLPQELWSDPDARFLDPVSKSGVFLREMAKRLMKGLEEQIPDKQERINHIFSKQLYGIAITELTSLLSRRSVYGSKVANGKYSFCEDFKDEQGNIIFERIEHTWHKGRCTFCGASQEVFDRGEELEAHAYQFIHSENPEEIFKMKFDVIIGNPPYQLKDGGAGASAKPIYQLFVNQAKKTNPRFISFIIPSRWFAGGKGLDEFRKEMINDHRIKILNDFPNAKECFPNNSIGGGVCYFLWEKEYNGKCRVINTLNGKSNSMNRYLNEYDVFVRDNLGIEIIKKINAKNLETLADIIESRNPFGFSSSERGANTGTEDDLMLYSSQGKGYIEEKFLKKNKELAFSYNVMFSKVTSEHAGEPDKDGKFRVLSTLEVLPPKNICTDSYLIAGSFLNEKEAVNLMEYLKTKTVRFLLLQAVTSINLSRDKFCFVPKVDFNERWTDEKLYKFFRLDINEIAHIDSLIKNH